MKFGGLKLLRDSTTPKGTRLIIKIGYDWISRFINHQADMLTHTFLVHRNWGSSVFISMTALFPIQHEQEHGEAAFVSQKWLHHLWVFQSREWWAFANGWASNLSSVIKARCRQQFSWSSPQVRWIVELIPGSYVIFCNRRTLVQSVYQHLCPFKNDISYDNLHPICDC